MVVIHARPTTGARETGCSCTCSSWRTASTRKRMAASASFARASSSPSRRKAAAAGSRRLQPQQEHPVRAGISAELFLGFKTLIVMCLCLFRNGENRWRRLRGCENRTLSEADDGWRDQQGGNEAQRRNTHRELRQRRVRGALCSTHLLARCSHTHSLLRAQISRASSGAPRAQLAPEEEESSRRAHGLLLVLQPIRQVVACLDTETEWLVLKRAGRRVTASRSVPEMLTHMRELSRW